MKISKNTASAYTYYEKYNKHFHDYTLPWLFKATLIILFPSLFSLNSSTNWPLNYQLTSFYKYNFYNLNILQHHMIYHIHNHNYYHSK